MNILIASVVVATRSWKHRTGQLSSMRVCSSSESNLFDISCVYSRLIAVEGTRGALCRGILI